MNTNVGLIEASAPQGPRRNAAEVVALMKTELAKADASVGSSSAIEDRRRPRRLESGATDQDVETDPRSPGRGVVFGLFLSLPLWVLIGLGVWFIV
jgi:hypothetical protein